MVKFFIDTANIDYIEDLKIRLKSSIEPDLIAGITTNPNAFKKINKFKLSEWEKHLPRLCELVSEMREDNYGVVYVQAPVSTMSLDEVFKFAEHISKFDDGNTKLGLKIPPFKNILEGVPQIEQIMTTNVTGISDAGTALFASLFEPTYISVIPGRMEEVGIDAKKHVEYLMDAIDLCSASQIISGSMRTIEGLLWVSEMGTVPTIGERVWDLIYQDMSILDKMNYEKVDKYFKTPYISHFAPHNDQRNTDLSLAFFKQMDEYGQQAYEDFLKKK
jgi:hypothetical protein